VLHLGSDAWKLPSALMSSSTSEAAAT
jgi:hypothetical protein